MNWAKHWRSHRGHIQGAARGGTGRHGAPVMGSKQSRWEITSILISFGFGRLLFIQM